MSDKENDKKKKPKNQSVAFTLFKDVFTVFLLAYAGFSALCVAGLFTASNFVEFDQFLITILLFVLSVPALILAVVYNIINYSTHAKAAIVVDALSRVAQGDYSYRIEYKEKDQFAEVYANFNKMAAELSSVNTLREGFIHDFSHEFKTPIASIHGFANVLLAGGCSPEEQAQFLKIIADESARLSRLSESTLLMSRLDNTLQLEKVPFRLDLQIVDCAILLENVWADKQIEFSSDLQEITVLGNEESLKQVWLNLILNAVKFTPNGGKISVEMKQDDDDVVVCVSDTGVGMPEDVQERVFDKYYQGDESHATQGNGLGLAIVKRICTLHGGEVWVQSKEGEGSSFYVRLPI